MITSKGRPAVSEAGGRNPARSSGVEKGRYSRHDRTREGIGSGHATGGLCAFSRARSCYQFHTTSKKVRAKIIKITPKKTPPVGVSSGACRVTLLVCASRERNEECFFSDVIASILIAHWRKHHVVSGARSGGLYSGKNTIHCSVPINRRRAG